MQKLSPPVLLSKYVEVTALYGSSTSSPEREAERGRNRVRERESELEWEKGGMEEGLWFELIHLF